MLFMNMDYKKLKSSGNLVHNTYFFYIYNGNEGTLIDVLRFCMKPTLQMVIKDVCIMMNERFASP